MSGQKGIIVYSQVTCTYTSTVNTATEEESKHPPAHSILWTLLGYDVIHTRRKHATY